MNNTETNYINHINQEKNKTPLADVIDVIERMHMLISSRKTSTIQAI